MTAIREKWEKWWIEGSMMVVLPLIGTMVPFNDRMLNVLFGLVALLSFILCSGLAIRDVFPTSKLGLWLRSYW